MSFDSLILLILGLLIGYIIGWWMAKNKPDLTSPSNMNDEDLRTRYVSKDLFENQVNQLDIAHDTLLEKEHEIRNLMSTNAGQKEIIANLNEKMLSHEDNLKDINQRFKLEFENLANRLLEEKSQKFAQQNETQISALLTPLREKIKDFEHSVEQKYIEETKERTSLKKEIEQLYQLNVQLSSDAANLVSALKGDNKAQGDWGEFRLEMILEKAGLNKDIHYKVQQSFTDVDGNQKRPDFIIQLPDNKHLVIDSKMSLTAYEKFFNESDDIMKAVHLKAHVDSMRRHIKDLASKNYQNLYQINSPDYLLLFVPIEPAFSLALQEDKELFSDALERNIVLVTTSTLLATMRTVSYLWKQEKQKNNVLEIARQSGLLYDKFVGFIEDLKRVGLQLDNARDSYQDAINKLNDSKKYGDTLVGRAERIKELGAKASRSIPADFLTNE
jgi:DNA recombination protein RmuC